MPVFIPFCKYQGTGNDFIFVDNRYRLFDKHLAHLVPMLCQRRFSIGADGFMVLQGHRPYDFEVIYYNADGSQSMCANGSRCAVRFAQYSKIIEQEAHFLTNDGAHRAFVKDDLVHLKMSDVTSLEPFSEGYLLDTGAPHYVTWVDSWQQLDVYKEGRAIRNSAPFQNQGINVSFVALEPDRTIFVRTYERGVEAETLSCGTGVVAAALVASTRRLKSPINVKTRGGSLQVQFQSDKTGFKDIYLIGPAKRIFQGVIDLEHMS